MMTTAVTAGKRAGPEFFKGFSGQGNSVSMVATRSFGMLDKQFETFKDKDGKVYSRHEIEYFLPEQIFKKAMRSVEHDATRGSVPDQTRFAIGVFGLVAKGHKFESGEGLGLEERAAVWLECAMWKGDLVAMEVLGELLCNEGPHTCYVGSKPKEGKKLLETVLRCGDSKASKALGYESMLGDANKLPYDHSGLHAKCYNYYT